MGAELLVCAAAEGMCGKAMRSVVAITEGTSDNIFLDLRCDALPQELQTYQLN
jgi:hypothetical protein